MKPYYEIAGLSKQAYHKEVKKIADKRDRTAYYIVSDRKRGNFC